MPRLIRYCLLLSMSFQGHCSFTLRKRNSPPTLLKIVIIQDTWAVCLFLEKTSTSDHTLDLKLYHIILRFLASTYALDSYLPYCLTSLTLKSITFSNYIPQTCKTCILIKQKKNSFFFSSDNDTPVFIFF